MAAPLAGVKVVEIGQVLSGPFAGVWARSTVPLPANLARAP
jgi:hypothetical protein